MRLIIGDVYQGRSEYARATYGEDITIYKGLFEDIKAMLEEGLLEEEITETILKKAMDYDLVIAEEGYGGLTPIDRSERAFTEVYGRSLTAVAHEAESVERVVCGLAITLK